MDEDEVVSDPLRDMEMLAFEGIKDRINSLDWDEMQNLVAGVLRSMGYKTQVSPAGPIGVKTSLLHLMGSVLKIPYYR
jgi:restriction system protein